MTSEKSPDAAQMDADEISLADIFAFFQKNLKVIAALAVLGAILGVGTTFVLQKQWEGKVTLQVGRAAGSPVAGPDGPLIESLQQTVGRIQLSAFRDNVASEVLPQLRGNTDELRKSVVWKALKARTIQGTAYVEIVARGTSPDEARQTLNAAAHLIQTEHAAILERARALPKQQLSVIDAAIEANTKAQEQLSKALVNSKNTDSVMALSALQSSRTERASLNESRFRAAQMLAPDQSYNTRIISDIQVDDQGPAFPRKSFFGAGGLILGVILGILIGLIRKTRSERVAS
ncbi:Wzz/FepE/Etk N-terminal domain-containing protein [Pandoraea pulmonicola]|uniref:Capsular polysaccharide biosynthesis protein n=2 Tax=Pandoraea pulmonicola TaxID=93221 RepID=A0AAJ4ZE05_PANPU|nr:Wzz/FepE/Etk N-terminal domain-containing protein [Pandoraea pulmonicola]SUA91709.1 Capsular polysaccharide biosynthesis protein [Pandoraea pulmonicola]